MTHHFSYTFSEAENLYKQAKALNDIPYETNKAIALLENSIQLFPNYTEAHFDLGRLNARIQNFEKARKEYNKAIVLNPFYARAYYHLAVLCEEKFMEYDHAKQNYEKAIEIKINYFEAYYKLANLEETQLKNFVNAKNYYLSAYKLKPDNKNVAFRLAKLFHEKLTDYAAAKKYYLKAIESYPDFAEAHYCLSKLYAENLNNEQKGKEHYLRATELNHNLRSHETDMYFSIDRVNKTSFIKQLLRKIAG